MAGVLTNDPEKWGYAARTDIQLHVLQESKWFRLPYPGQWGMPKVNLAGVLGMMAGMLASVIESLGDYYACARLSGAPSPPGYAINRGIGVEGITCILAGVWGTGGGNTSYSENVGAIGITKVGSRLVVQTAGILMILLGCLGKFGALFVTIPEPVVGGLFYILFGMVGAVGISNLQFVPLNSPRNLFVFGVPLFFGLSVPGWLNKNPGAIVTGNENLDQVLRVLCGTNMLVGGALAFLLDNTIPGTPKERGLVAWGKVEGTNETKGDLSVYNLPLIQPWLDRLPFIRYIPVCPSFVLEKKTREDDGTQIDGIEENCVIGVGNERSIDKRYRFKSPINTT
ncbi:hypothetical protein RRG08_004044 [Elysia crispata]|uniref:Solute carrier family 23 member 1 n=1 Tax=Elysia crispata TaxID=231223 RepID=A0AAE1E0W7_9GAST|nr:hypothetical protein RRG08_004044 [Elysia crispata]